MADDYEMPCGFKGFAIAFIDHAHEAPEGHYLLVEKKEGLSLSEAQELHELVGALRKGLLDGKEYLTLREANRALELAALVISDALSRVGENE